MVDMSATLLHHGHVRLLQKASEYGDVIIGLTSDDEILYKKGYSPELLFDERKEVLESIKYVKEVVETPWLIDESVLDEHDIDLLVHGDDNSNLISKERLLVFPRTKGISSSELRYKAQESILSQENQKLMLTPGPASILPDNLKGIVPVFGRGDETYQNMYSDVEKWILNLSGQDELVCMQGSSTLALELSAKTFLYGRVLLINTGYYSERLGTFVDGSVCDLDVIEYEDMDNVTESYDWVLCAYTETSTAFKVNLTKVREKSNALGAKLYIDATGSIGLEDLHELADLMAFSSCKGLFGLTGAAFIAHKSMLNEKKQDNFYFNVDTHRNKSVTGPYHAIASLHSIIQSHSMLRERVRSSKSLFMSAYSKYIESSDNQPLLCSYVKGKVSAVDDNVVLYQPRSNLPGSVVCHLGEIFSERVNMIERISVEDL